jgi:hypothetical protein
MTVLSRLRGLSTNVRRHVGWFVRDRFPNRRVVREVQGVRMVLPWPHRLPDYAGDGPYGQNLVELATLLASDDAPIAVLDIGADVGDSTLQVMNAADARVLCIESDPHFLEYLHLNVDDDPRVSVVEALLTPDARTAARAAAAVRTVTPAQLREQFPGFADLRLIKSDTDGYDVALVPAVAEEWRDAQPVLFFEYDHHLSRTAGHDPLAVWPRLKRLGYLDVAVWGNDGHSLGRTTVDEIAERTAPLEARVRIRARTYWDVAVVHRDDAPGLAAIEKLVPASQPL